MATTSIAITHALRGVRAQLGGGAFAPFTPIDSAAWEAFVCAAELYRRCGDETARRDSALRALGAALAAAERSYAVHRAFVYALIITLDHVPADVVVAKLWPQLDGLAFVELQLRAEVATG